MSEWHRFIMGGGGQGVRYFTVGRAGDSNHVVSLIHIAWLW